MTFDEIYQLYAPLMAKRESTNNYNSEGPLITYGMHAGTKAQGKYQFMPETLKGLGFDPKGFISDPNIQEQAMYKFTKQNYDTAVKAGLINENTSPAHIAGLLASAHVSGSKGMLKAAKGIEGPADTWGTTPLKYYKRITSDFNKLSLNPSDTTFPDQPNQVGLATPYETKPKNTLDVNALPAINSPAAATPQTSTSQALFKPLPDSPFLGYADDVESEFKAYSNEGPTVLGDYSRGIPTWIETFSSTVVRENPIFNFVVNKAMHYPEEFNTLMNKTRGTYKFEDDPENVKYAEIANQLGASDSIEEATFYKTIHDKMMEDKYREYVGPSSAMFAGTVVAGFADPTSYVPFTAVGKAAKALTTFEKVLAGAAIGAASGAAQEGLLNYTDPTRTSDESYGNIVGQALFSGALGPVLLKQVGKHADKSFKLGDEAGSIDITPEMKQNYIDALNDSTVGIKGKETAFHSFLSGDNPRSYELAEGSWAFRQVMKGLKKLNSSPAVTAMTSASQKAREFIFKAGNSPLVTKDMEKGFAAEKTLFDAKQRWDLDSEYVQSNFNNLRDTFRKANPDAESNAFDDAVIRAVEDPDFKVVKGDPVSDAVAIHREVMQRNLETGKRFGVFSEDIPTNANYFPRVLNRQAVLANPQGAQKALEDALAQSDAFNGSAKDAAREYISNFLQSKSGDEVLFNFNGVQSAFAKSRSIPLEVSRALDPYLEKNLNKIHSRYAHSVGTPASYREVYGASPKEVYDTVKADYEKLLAQAVDNDSYLKLTKEMDQVLKVVDSINKIHFGQYGRFSNQGLNDASAIARTISVATKSATMGISQLPEYILARKFAVPVEQLFGKQISKGNLELVGELAKADKETFDLVRIGIDASAEIYSNLKFGSASGEFVDSLVETTLADVNHFIYKNVNGVIRITEHQQKIAVNHSIAYLLHAAVGDVEGALSAEAATMLRSLGVTPSQSALLVQEFRKNNIKLESGQLFPNFSKWSPEAQQIVSDKVIKMVDMSIIKPQSIDKPLISQTASGKIIFQFMSYMFGATNQRLLPLLQKGTGHDWALAGGAVMLGSASYAIKELYAVKYRGDNREMRLDTGSLVAAGIDNSGFLGHLSLANSWLEAGFNLGLNPMLSGQKATKFKGRDFTDVVAGPALGSVNDVIKLFQGLRDGKLSESEARRASRLVPGLNTVYGAWLIDWTTNALKSQDDTVKKLKANKYNSHVLSRN